MTPVQRREHEARLIKVLDLEGVCVAADVRAWALASPEVRARLLDVLSKQRGKRFGDCLDCATAGAHRRICHGGPCETI